MRVARPLLVLFLCSCAAPPPPLQEPTIQVVPSALIAQEGASLYVFEGPENWWHGMVPSPERVDLPGLRRMLRHGLSQEEVTLVGHADFQPYEGSPAEATLFNPDSEAHRAPKGTGIGFRVTATANRITTEEDDHCALAWRAEKLIDRPGKNREIRREIEGPIEGRRTLRFGESCVTRFPSSTGREYTLVIRLRSLRKP